MQFKHALLASSVLLAASLTVATAQAQTRAGTSAAASNTIEELVVTAEKREQSLQDVPVAISAFTGKQRDLVGINTIQDLTNFTPGFVYQSQNDRASMRGIGRLTNVHSVDGAVSIYIDGLFTTSTVLAGAPPLETDRVEILRGPQGTLYGRNAIGGAVNVISPRPTEQPYAEVRAIGENFGFTNFQVAASGPLAEGLGFRFSAYKLDQRTGYYNNVNPGLPSEGSKRDEYEYQFQVQAKLGENADFWLNYKSLNWDNRGGPGARAGFLNAPYEGALIDPRLLLTYNSAFGYTNGIVPGSLVQFGEGTTTVNPAVADHHDFNTNEPQHVRLTDVHSLTTHFTYHLPTFDVKYVGGLQNYRYDFTGDTDETNVKSFQIPLATGSVCGTVHTLFSVGRSTVDCSPRTVNADNTFHYFEYPTWYSHEINIASTNDSPLQWIVGAFYYNEHYRGTGSTADFFIKGASPLNTPILGAANNPDGVWSTGVYELTTESKALFGQVDWQVADTVKLTFGLRYTKDHKFGTEFRRLVCDNDACYTPLYAAAPPNGIGLSAFGPGTAANWGSLLGNLAALPAVGQALGLGNALAGLGGLGNGALDITSSQMPTTGPAGARGVTSPVTCRTATICTQFVIDPATGVARRQLGHSSDAVTGTAGVQWDPSEDTMAYARYSRGYKAFGFSAGAYLAEPVADPEFVNSYEIGLKTNFGSNLQVNLAAYYLDYRDLQAPVSVRVGAVNVSQFVNIAKSRSDGVELDVIWQPIQPMRITFDYSYNDTKIKKALLLTDLNDFINKNPISIVGNSLPQAPKHKLALNASYSFLMDPGTLTLGATYAYRSKAFSNVFSRDYNSAPSWDQVDLRAHWSPTGNKYTIIAYVKNVADTDGYDAALTGNQRSNMNAAQNLELTPPRTYGIELQYRFF